MEEPTWGLCTWCGLELALEDTIIHSQSRGGTVVADDGRIHNLLFGKKAERYEKKRIKQLSKKEESDGRPTDESAGILDPEMPS